MPMNILNKFKTELGYVNATNQYTELAARIYNIDHEHDELSELAHKVGLSVNALPENIRIRIAKGYIVSIQSIIEKFLYTFIRLDGLQINATNPYNPENDKSRLKWTIKVCGYDNIPSDILCCIDICEYYRLVRNEIVHMGEKGVDYRSARNRVLEINEELRLSKLSVRLNAPNEINCINFDDQVLFSRCAKLLCSFIYNNSRYDWNNIVEKDKFIKEVLRSMPNTDKRNIKIKRYLMQNYPINNSEEQIDLILSTYC